MTEELTVSKETNEEVINHFQLRMAQALIRKAESGQGGFYRKGELKAIRAAQS